MRPLTVGLWLQATPNLTRLDKERLLAARLGMTRTQLLTYPETELNAATQSQLEHDVLALADDMPLAYLLGAWEFYGLELKVSEDVLIPRPDTELLVDLVLADAPQSARVLDLGTGSGAIAIAIKHNRPDLQVDATDLSKAALRIAQANAKAHDAEIQFLQGSWFEPVCQQYDIIVSNPPYIAEADTHLPQLRHEPITALTADVDGLSDLRLITTQATKHLRRAGHCLVEHGWTQGPAVRDLFTQHGYSAVATHRDLADHERVTCGTWTGDV